MQQVDLFVDAAYREHQAYQEMYERAARNGLGWEVSEMYKRFRQQGDSPEQAAHCALLEWDC